MMQSNRILIRSNNAVQPDPTGSWSDQTMQSNRIWPDPDSIKMMLSNRIRPDPDSIKMMLSNRIRLDPDPIQQCNQIEYDWILIWLNNVVQPDPYNM